MGTAALAAITTALASTGAEAVTFGSSAISNNDGGNVAIGESQLFVDITAVGSDRVLFKFSNLGPAASAITQIYFDDVDSSPYLLQTGVILSDSDPLGGTGVRYQNLALGGNLPDSNNSMPGGGDFDEDFNFVPQNQGGTSNNGIGVNEWAGFEFALASTKTFAGLLDAIAKAPSTSASTSKPSQTVAAKRLSITPRPNPLRLRLPRRNPLPTQLRLRLPRRSPRPTRPPLRLPHRSLLPTRPPLRLPHRSLLPTRPPLRLPHRNPLPTQLRLRLPRRNPLPTRLRLRLPRRSPLPIRLRLPRPLPIRYRLLNRRALLV